MTKNESAYPPEDEDFVDPVQGFPVIEKGFADAVASQEQIDEAMRIMQADPGNDTLPHVAQSMMDWIATLEEINNTQRAEITELQQQVSVLQAQTATNTFAPYSMASYITMACAEIRTMLLAKNKAYGNSAAEPVRIFSKADPLEQLNVRIDDKLSRMMRGTGYPGDDDELDLIGYLILRRAVKSYQADETVA